MPSTPAVTFMDVEVVVDDLRQPHIILDPHGASVERVYASLIDTESRSAYLSLVAQVFSHIDSMHDYIKPMVVAIPEASHRFYGDLAMWVRDNTDMNYLYPHVEPYQYQRIIEESRLGFLDPDELFEYRRIARSRPTANRLTKLYASMYDVGTLITDNLAVSVRRVDAFNPGGDSVLGRAKEAVASFLVSASHNLQNSVHSIDSVRQITGFLCGSGVQAPLTSSQICLTAIAVQSQVVIPSFDEVWYRRRHVMGDLRRVVQGVLRAQDILSLHGRRIPEERMRQMCLLSEYVWRYFYESPGSPLVFNEIVYLDRALDDLCRRLELAAGSFSSSVDLFNELVVGPENIFRRLDTAERIIIEPAGPSRPAFSNGAGAAAALPAAQPAIASQARNPLEYKGHRLVLADDGGVELIFDSSQKGNVTVHAGSCKAAKDILPRNKEFASTKDLSEINGTPVPCVECCPPRDQWEGIAQRLAHPEIESVPADSAAATATSGLNPALFHEAPLVTAPVDDPSDYNGYRLRLVGDEGLELVFDESQKGNVTVHAGSCAAARGILPRNMGLAATRNLGDINGTPVPCKECCPPQDQWETLVARIVDFNTAPIAARLTKPAAPDGA